MSFRQRNDNSGGLFQSRSWEAMVAHINRRRKRVKSKNRVKNVGAKVYSLLKGDAEDIDSLAMGEPTPPRKKENFSRSSSLVVDVSFQSTGEWPEDGVILETSLEEGVESEITLDSAFVNTTPVRDTYHFRRSPTMFGMNFGFDDENDSTGSLLPLTSGATTPVYRNQEVTPGDINFKK